MKTYIKITLFLIFFIFLLGIKGVKAQEEYTRSIKKDFPVNADAQLVVNNKFGKVHCTNWENNSISIDIRITVTAFDQSSANKMLDKINISFSNTPSLVEAKTMLDNFKSPRKGFFSIDYEVRMPIGVSLDITNKFGDIFIHEVQGKTKIDLAYGNMKANKLGNSDNLLIIGFSNANIAWMKGAVIELKYSTLELDYAGSLRLDSKYSNLEAQKIIILNTNFEGGNLRMESTSSIESKIKFSDLKIGRIEKSLNLDIQYGSFVVKEIPAEFTSINIKNKYGNVSVGLEGASYNLDAELRFCELDFPEKNAKLSYRSSSPTEKSYKGTIQVGSSTPVANVKVRSEFGNITLK